MWQKTVRLTLAAVFLLAACQAQRGSANDMLPDIPNSTVVEGQTITQFIANLANGAALTAGNPELTPLIQRVETSLSCYQNAGAVAVRTYADKTFPLYAGIVAIVDQNALTSPANFLNCVVKPQPEMQSRQQVLQPCAKTYTLKKDGNEFYIAYIATTPQMCDAFCSKLEGCAVP